MLKTSFQTEEAFRLERYKHTYTHTNRTIIIASDGVLKGIIKDSSVNTLRKALYAVLRDKSTRRCT